MLVGIVLQPLSQAVEQFSEMRWTRSLLTLELEERLEFGVGTLDCPVICRFTRRVVVTERLS